MRFEFVRAYWRRAVIAVVALTALVAVVGFFAVPPILKSVLVSQLSQALHRPVTLREVSFNPFTLAATISGLTVKEPKGDETFASLERLYVNLESSSLFRWAAVISEIRVTKPFLRVVRRADQSYNFSDLLPAPKAAPAPSSKPPRFSLNNIRIEDGSADFLDEIAQRKHTIRDLSVGIPFLSNIPSYVQRFVEPGLSVVVNGTRYSLQGKTKPFADSEETTLDVAIQDLDLPFYLAYVPPELLTFAMPSGRLNGKLVVAFIRSDKGGQSLTVKGNLNFQDLAIQEKTGAAVVHVPSIDIDIASIGVFAQMAYFSRIAVEKPELFVRRDKDGGTNLQTLLPKASTTPKDKSAPVAGDQLLLDVDELTVSGATVQVTDLVPATAFRTTLAPVDVTLKQISTRHDINGTYSVTMRTEAAETLALEGGFSLIPLTVDGQIEGKTVLLKKYAPYYADRIRAVIEAGTLDFSSRYRYAQTDKEPEITASSVGGSLNGLRLSWPGTKTEFLRIPVLTVADTSADLNKHQIVVGSFSSSKGMVSTMRLPNGAVDLQSIMAPAPDSAPAGPPAEATAPWTITLKRLAVDRYAVTVEDRAAAAPTTVNADQIRIQGENLSTAKNTTGKLSVSLMLDKKTRVSTESTVGLDPIQADGRAEITDLVLKQYAPYYQNRVVFDIQEGMLSATTRYRVTQAKDNLDIKVSSLTATLKSLSLITRDTKSEFLKIPLLAVKNTAADLTKQEITVGEFSTDGGIVQVERARDGEINLARLLPRTTAAAETLAAGPVVVARPWVVFAAAIGVSRYQINVRDNGPTEPVAFTIDDLAFKVEKISTAVNSVPSTTSVTFRIKDGTVAVDGKLDVAPVLVDVQVAAKDLDIRPFQPYVTDRVRVTLTDGRVSTTGHLTLSTKEPGLQAAYTGDILVAKLAVLEKATSSEILTWQSLALNGVIASSNPLAFHANKVALADFFAQVVLQPDGTLNLKQILQPADAAPAAPAVPVQVSAQPQPAPTASAAALPDIRIDEVTLQGGRIAFGDESVKPTFTADLDNIGGRVSGLSSAENSRADLELRGRFNNSAPLEITGKVNPLGKDLYADIRARFTGMDLSPTSPYAGKYVGYSIEKGKLSFDIDYHIDNRKLQAENKVFIDQFTFGEKVESPTATGLPVKLAVALLKDRNGEIHLDLPVTGSLDDPKFSIWGVVWQIVGNLITKAVTSPFALLGAAFSGAEGGTQYVEFQPGLAVLDDKAAKTLEALRKGLAEKPSLKLEVAGYVDPDTDREGLKQYLLQRKVKAQKLNTMVKKGAAAVPVDDVIVEPSEYEQYLTEAYRAETFPKPRNFIGLVKSLPIPEMEKLMLTHIEVGDNELRQLAARRAGAVRDAILQGGAVDPERVFIIEPKSLTPEKTDKAKNSRVELKIA